MTAIQGRCPDCGVAAGQLHGSRCDVEQCPDCGGQALSCECEGPPFQRPRMPWTGQWPADVVEELPSQPAARRRRRKGKRGRR